MKIFPTIIAVRDGNLLARDLMKGGKFERRGFIDPNTITTEAARMNSRLKGAVEQDSSGRASVVIVRSS